MGHFPGPVDLCVAPDRGFVMFRPETLSCVGIQGT